MIPSGSVICNPSVPRSQPTLTVPTTHYLLPPFCTLGPAEMMTIHALMDSASAISPGGAHIVEAAQALCSELSAGRDESHNYEHSAAVATLAASLYVDDVRREDPSSSPEDTLRYDIMTVAYLHDVADHKYDADGTAAKRLRLFLQEHYGEQWQSVYDCIGAISFSKERASGYGKLTCDIAPYWVGVRNYVSDADKLEALGTNGARRCALYGQKYVIDKEGSCTNSQMVAHLNQHVIDKLAFLYRYMRTQSGIKLAIEATEELTKEVARINLNLMKGVPLWCRDSDGDLN